MSSTLASYVDTALTTVDLSGKTISDHVTTLFDKFDDDVFKGTIATLSADINNPRNIEIAGILIIHEVVKAAGSIESYLKNFSHRLHPDVHMFMFTHSGEYQNFLDKYNMLNYYDQDVFSASTFIKNYALAPHYGEKPLESPIQMYLRITTHMYMNSPGALDTIFGKTLEMAIKLYTQASPSLYNLGTTKSQGSSCFLATIDDNLDSILGTGVHDMGKISQHKGGIGIGLGKLRHSAIKGGGMASGVIPVARILDKLVLYVDQGGARSGAGTAHLPLWHYDVYEFVNSTNNFGQSQVNRLQFLNTCVWIPDLFVRRATDREAMWTVFCPARAKLFGLHGSEFDRAYVDLEEEASLREVEYEDAKAEYGKARIECMATGDTVSVQLNRMIKAETNRIVHKKLNAYDLLSHICDVQIKSGFPFVMYGDSINTKSNQANIGPVNSSNLCVSGDTLILTREHGYKRIDELTDTSVNVWNGKEWSVVWPKKTSDNSKLVRVTLDNGLYLDCTEYHKFLMYGGPRAAEIKHTNNIKSCKRVDASRLKVGDKMLQFEYPTLQGSLDNDAPYPVSLDKMPKSVIPPSNSSVGYRVEWLAQRIDSDGTVSRGGTSIEFRSEYYSLRRIQLLISTLGVSSTCCPADDGSGEFVLTIPSRGLHKLAELGLTSDKLKGCVDTYDDGTESNRFVKVVGVEDLGITAPTYCFTEKVNNAGVFGGILTGNCVEIVEVSTPDSIASCNLSSISLRKFVRHSNVPHFHALYTRYMGANPDIRKNGPAYVDDVVMMLYQSGAYDFKMLGHIVQSTVVNLEKIITNNYYPVPGKTKPSNMEARPLGIGVSGLDDAIKSLDLYFDSEEADAFNKGVFACMYYNALLQSSTLASETEPYKYFDTKSFEIETIQDRDTLGELYPTVKFSPHAPTRLVDETGGGVWVHTLVGSPISNGLFQFDLWKLRADVLRQKGHLSEGVYNSTDDVPVDPRAWGQEIPSRFGNEADWKNLRDMIKSFGMRHSMLLTCMPTASTGQLLRNAESTEVHGSNLYSRAVKCGNFIVFNQNLYRDLSEIGFYNSYTVEYLMASKGSMKHFVKYVKEYAPEGVYDTSNLNMEIVEHIVRKYRTMFEISQKDVLKKARQRGIYIDQSQSTNIYLEDPSVNTMRAVHSYGNKLGLKTGLYYLRQRNAAEGGGYTLSANMTRFKSEVIDGEGAIKKVLPAATIVDDGSNTAVGAVCTREMREQGDCLMCG